VVARGRLMQALPEGGAMVALQASEDEVLPLLSASRVGVAAVNGPRAVVVSGDGEAVEEIAAHFRALDRKVTALRVSHAFHSPLMEPMLAEFRAVAESLTYERPRLPLVSTVTGAPVAADDLTTPDYWVEHVRATVRYADAVRALAAGNVTRFVELGPDGTLTALAQDTVTDRDRLFVPVLRKDRPGTGTFAAAVAAAFVRGADVDWSRLFPAVTAPVADLPTYAFRHQRYWPTVPAATGPVRPGGEIDARFWEAVEQADVTGLADALDVGEDALGAVLPALTSWRRRSVEQAAVDGLRYRVRWRPLTANSGPARLSGRWLVVQPARPAAGPWTESVVDGLVAGGADVERLTFEDGTDRTALAARLRDLAPMTGVVSLLASADTFPVTETPLPSSAHGEDRASDDATAAVRVPLGVSTSLLLVQALGDAGVHAPLWTLTRSAVSVGRADGGAVDAAQAAVWGLGRVAALEAAGRWGGLLDLPADLDARAVGRLLTVLSGAVTAEDQVAIRASGLFGRRLERMPVAERGPVWRPRGTVLVTGGTGALGAHVARWAAQEGARELVLVSRR
ncbi:acyltransferase domain-containing protein, partial [Streptomyces heilongjiangensis]